MHAETRTRQPSDGGTGSPLPRSIRCRRTSSASASACWDQVWTLTNRCRRVTPYFMSDAEETSSSIDQGRFVAPLRWVAPSGVPGVLACLCAPAHLWRPLHPLRIMRPRMRSVTDPSGQIGRFCVPLPALLLALSLCPSGQAQTRPEAGRPSIDELIRTVVTFEVTTPEGEGTGSGVVVDASGIVATAAHVITPLGGTKELIQVRPELGSLAKAPDEVIHKRHVHLGAAVPEDSLDDSDWGSAYAERMDHHEGRARSSQARTSLHQSLEQSYR